MIYWDDEQLKEANIDKKRLTSLVRRLERCARDMREMGLHIYGASGSGNLIHKSRPTHKTGRNRETADFGSVVASVGLGFDGGDW
jgi:hypothetical protein